MRNAAPYMRRALVSLLSVAVVVLGLAAPAGAADDPTTTVLVRLAGPPTAALSQALGELHQADAEPADVDAYASIPWAAVDVDAEGRAILERSAAVLDVVDNQARSLSLDQTIPKVKA